MDIESFKKDAEANYDKHKSTIKQLRKAKKLDDKFHEAHEKAFEVIDCLDCANCCKTTSPIFYDPDIERLAKTLKMKTIEFIDCYLHKDEDNDYVLNETPCPFLGHDNKCIVYDNRPKACRGYPHTNRKRMKQILTLTLTNSQVCPAVNEILKIIDQ